MIILADSVCWGIMGKCILFLKRLITFRHSEIPWIFLFFFSQKRIHNIYKYQIQISLCQDYQKVKWKCDVHMCLCMIAGLSGWVRWTGFTWNSQTVRSCVWSQGSRMMGITWRGTVRCGNIYWTQQCKKSSLPSDKVVMKYSTVVESWSTSSVVLPCL